VYRRPASRYRRPPNGQKKEDESETLQLVVQAEDIPMPNEADIPPLPFGDVPRDSGLGLFRILGNDFFLDDLILIGLIIILIQEKVEDELLLIIIGYILLF